jgi:hypothetical protein
MPARCILASVVQDMPLSNRLRPGSRAARAKPPSISACWAVFAAARGEMFDLPLSVIEMVRDESRNLCETALGQSQYRDERARDESQNQD